MTYHLNPWQRYKHVRQQTPNLSAALRQWPGHEWQTTRHMSRQTGHFIARKARHDLQQYGAPAALGTLLLTQSAQPAQANTLQHFAYSQTGPEVAGQVFDGKDGNQAVQAVSKTAPPLKFSPFRDPIADVALSDSYDEAMDHGRWAEASLISGLRVPVVVHRINLKSQNNEFDIDDVTNSFDTLKTWSQKNDLDLVIGSYGMAADSKEALSAKHLDYYPEKHMPDYLRSQPGKIRNFQRLAYIWQKQLGSIPGVKIFSAPNNAHQATIPADLPGVISVGATDPLGKPAEYSGRARVKAWADGQVSFYGDEKTGQVRFIHTSKVPGYADTVVTNRGTSFAQPTVTSRFINTAYAPSQVFQPWVKSLNPVEQKQLLQLIKPNKPLMTQVSGIPPAELDRRERFISRQPDINPKPKNWLDLLKLNLLRKGRGN